MLRELSPRIWLAPSAATCSVRRAASWSLPSTLNWRELRLDNWAGTSACQVSVVRAAIYAAESRQAGRAEGQNHGRRQCTQLHGVECEELRHGQGGQLGFAQGGQLAGRQPGMAVVRKAARSSGSSAATAWVDRARNWALLSTEVWVAVSAGSPQRR
jgi:hypothetical protein